jgi:hypothetical protein
MMEQILMDDNHFYVELSLTSSPLLTDEYHGDS